MMNPGEKSTPFEPSMVFREILRPVTRQAISRWLATHPTSADGDPVIAIHQALFCEPVRDLIRCRRKIPLPALKKNQYPGHTYQPIVHHNHGFGNLWNGEVTCNHMAQYREPFFFLSHDETYLRLVNSQLSILLQPQGSNIHLVHLAAGSLLISQACADGLLPADHDSADRAQALITAILPTVKSYHDRAARMATIRQMNEMIPHLYSIMSCNSAAYTPVDIPSDMTILS